MYTAGPALKVRLLQLCEQDHALRPGVLYLARSISIITFGGDGRLSALCDEVKFDAVIIVEGNDNTYFVVLGLSVCSLE